MIPVWRVQTRPKMLLRCSAAWRGSSSSTGRRRWPPRTVKTVRGGSNNFALHHGKRLAGPGPLYRLLLHRESRRSQQLTSPYPARQQRHGWRWRQSLPLWKRSRMQRLIPHRQQQQLARAWQAQRNEARARRRRHRRARGGPHASRCAPLLLVARSEASFLLCQTAVPFSSLVLDHSPLMRSCPDHILSPAGKAGAAG